MVVLAFRGVSDVDLVVFVAAFLGDRCDWDGTFDQGLPWLWTYRGNYWTYPLSQCDGPTILPKSNVPGLLI